MKAPDGDRFFGDHGLWMDQLYVKYDTYDHPLTGDFSLFGGLTLFAGKFNPNFGIAFEDAPYIYGRDFAEDYETTEKIGLGGSVRLAPEGWGKHALTGAVFFQDSTVLSNSVLSRPRVGDPFNERPRRLKKKDGGLANTRSLESFTVSLDGHKMPFAEGLEYTLGYRYLKRGATEEFSEKGVVAGLHYEFELAEDLTLTPLVEFAHFEKFDGGDATARYITGGLTLQYGPWALLTSYTDRRIKGGGAEPFKDKDRLFQVSGGYTFDFGLGLYAGWKTQRVEGVTSDTFGVMAVYGVSF